MDCVNGFSLLKLLLFKIGCLPLSFSSLLHLQKHLNENTWIAHIDSWQECFINTQALKYMIKQKSLLLQYERVNFHATTCAW